MKCPKCGAQMKQDEDVYYCEKCGCVLTFQKSMDD